MESRSGWPHPGPRVATQWPYTVPRHGGGELRQQLPQRRAEGAPRLFEWFLPSLNHSAVTRPDSLPLSWLCRPQLKSGTDSNPRSTLNMNACPHFYLFTRFQIFFLSRSLRLHPGTFQRLRVSTAELSTIYNLTIWRCEYAAGFTVNN